MSETDIKALPPRDVFICDRHGLTKWRAALAGIAVQRSFGGVHLRAFGDGTEVRHDLDPTQARHLAGLLLAAADATPEPKFFEVSVTVDETGAFHVRPVMREVAE